MYIAGPFEQGNVMDNVGMAVRAGELIRAHGGTPIVPHAQGALHAIAYPHIQRDEWMRMCREWLSRCDVVMRLVGESKGADEETSLAEDMSIPVIRVSSDISASELKYTLDYGRRYRKVHGHDGLFAAEKEINRLQVSLEESREQSRQADEHLSKERSACEEHHRTIAELRGLQATAERFIDQYKKRISELSEAVRVGCVALESIKGVAESRPPNGREVVAETAAQALKSMNLQTIRKEQAASTVTNVVNVVSGEAVLGLVADAIDRLGMSDNGDCSALERLAAELRKAGGK